LLGCGPGGSTIGGADGGPDGPLPDASDGALADAVYEGASSDALSERASADAVSQGGASADATTSPTDAGVVIEANQSADAQVGTLVVTVDATLIQNDEGGTCAAVDSLAAIPNETAVGQSILLTASGIDPQGQSSDVILTWAAVGSAGSLADTSGASTSFNCTGAGTEMVTVTASISSGGASCPAIGSLTVTLACSSP
jgi:hypothetical protein